MDELNRIDVEKIFSLQRESKTRGHKYKIISNSQQGNKEKCLYLAWSEYGFAATGTRLGQKVQMLQKGNFMITREKKEYKVILKDQNEIAGTGGDTAEI